MFEMTAEIVAPHVDKMKNVLNHGDFWINNMMFQYDGTATTNPQDIRLVDLQICRFSSQALDLQYFVVTSIQEQVRAKIISPYACSRAEQGQEKVFTHKNG